MAARFRLAALCLFLSLVTSACGGGSGVRPKVTFTAAEGVAHAPAPHGPAEVEILALGAPARPHVTVGRLIIREDDDDLVVERDALMQALRARAAELGCDAVLLEPPFDEPVRVRVRFEHLTRTRPVLHGACIVHE